MNDEAAPDGDANGIALGIPQQQWNYLFSLGGMVLFNLITRKGSIIRLCFVLTGILLLGVAASAISAAQSIAEKLPMEVLYQAKDPISIPVSAKPEHVSVEMPTAQAEPGKVLCIRFKGYYPVDTPPAHWADYYLKMEVNGKTLGASLADESERVLNRPNKQGGYPIWIGDRLVVVIGKDKPALDAGDEGYWQVLNISDVGEYISKGADNSISGGKPNKIVFTSYRLDKAASPSPKEMRIEGLEMGYVPKETVDRLKPVTVIDVPKLTGKTLTAGGYKLTVTPTGAMSIQCGQETYAFRSAFSYPGETTMGFHRFTWEQGNDSEWKIGEIAGDQGVVTVKGDAKTYSIVRKITAKDGKFYITDTVTNKTSEPLGMAVRHDVVSTGRLSLNDAYLSGVPGIRDDTACGGNPTIFIRNAGGSLGIAVEDEVWPFQLSMNKKPNSVQFGTEHFGLEPYKSYTLEWSLYPSRDTDYFGFVNRLRKDWNVNYTLPGMFAMSNKPLIGIKVKYLALDPWLECQNGALISEDDWVKRVKADVATLTAWDPEVTCMPKLELPTIALRRSKIENGDKIPKTPKRVDLELNDEQTEIIKKAVGPLWDSMPQSKSGHAIIDTWYSGENGGDDFDIGGYPTPGNGWYKHMLSQVDLAMDKAGCKGIYMDSFEYGYEFDSGLDYTRWDGHSVTLDHLGRIASKMTNISMASASGRSGILRYVIGKGGMSVVNGHPNSREMKSIPYLSFVETDWEQIGNYDDLLKLLTPAEPSVNAHMAMGHLSCPIALGMGMWRSDLFYSDPTPKDFGKDNTAEIQQKYVIVCLRNGQLFYPYAAIPSEGKGKGEYGIINEMFPFTPVELHEGYLIGKEKILTAVSGTFLWNISDHPAKPSICKAFDNKGYATTPKSFSVTKVGKQWKVQLALQQDWMGTAAIY
jgi:hypothetical protein